MKKLYALPLLLLSCLSFSTVYGQTWSALGSGVQGIISSMVVYNGNLYVGGQFTLAGDVSASNIAEWDGANWHVLGTGITGTNSEVFSLVVYNNELYAGGEFTQAGEAQVNNLAKWNGSVWSDVGGGVTSQYGEVSALAVYNNRLIVAGNFNLAGSIPVQNIAAWNGATWTSLDTTTLWTPTGMVNTMYVWNGELYCGGNGYAAAPDSPGVSIAKWNDTIWTILQNGLIDKSSEVSSFASFNGNLYVGGLFYGTGATDSTVYEIAKWTGTDWLGIGLCRDSDWMFGIGTSVLAPYNGSLYAGGYFSGVNGTADTCLSAYNGVAWVNPHAPQATLPAAYYASCVWNGRLYLGGVFDLQVGGIPDAINIVQYNDGTNGLKQIDAEENLKLYPNPASGQLVVENIVAGATVTVNNLLGQTVKSVTTDNSRVVMDISGLNAGMYFVNGAKFIKE